MNESLNLKHCLIQINESKDEIVQVHLIIKSKHESEKQGERQREIKIKNFDQVREYTRMKRMGDERLHEAQDMSETKIRKEIKGMTCCFTRMTLR